MLMLKWLRRVKLLRKPENKMGLKLCMRQSYWPHKNKNWTLENITQFLKVGSSKLPGRSPCQSHKSKPKASLLFALLILMTSRLVVCFWTPLYEYSIVLRWWHSLLLRLSLSIVERRTFLATLGKRKLKRNGVNSSLESEEVRQLWPGVEEM